MKKIITLSVVMLPQIILAQKSFTEADFKALNARYLKNPVAFMQNETTPNFVYTGTDGIVRDKAESLKIYDVLEEISREYSNIKVLQNGASAVVTSQMKHTVVIKPTGQKRIEDEVLTATLVNQNGKWLLQSAVHSFVPIDVNAEEAAIKQVIEGETQAYLDGDGKKLLSYWADKKTNERGGQNLVSVLGQPFAKGESMEKLQNVMVPILKKQDVRAERNDFEIRMNKNMAWVTFTRKDIASGGAVMQTNREIRILERINGDWKIVYLGQQAMK